MATPMRSPAISPKTGSKPARSRLTLARKNDAGLQRAVRGTRYDDFDQPQGRRHGALFQVGTACRRRMGCIHPVGSSIEAFHRTRLALLLADRGMWTAGMARRRIARH